MFGANLVILAPYMYIHHPNLVIMSMITSSKWKHFLRYFVMGFNRSTVDSRLKGQWRGALMLSLIFAWTNSWANNRDAVDLRRHRAHYYVTVMVCRCPSIHFQLAQCWLSSLKYLLPSLSGCQPFQMNFIDQATSFSSNWQRRSREISRHIDYSPIGLHEIKTRFF